MATKKRTPFPTGQSAANIPAGYKLVADNDEQNQTPEARGKAAALSSYLARKGSPTKGRRLDRAMAKFETMWAQAPTAIKEKYAGRSQKTDLAPSEANPPIPRPTNASLNAAKPGETPSQTKERQRQSRTGTKAVATPSATKTIFDELTKAPAIPEGGVNSVGDGVFEGGKAKRIEQANALMQKATTNPPTPEQRSGPDTYVPDKPAAAGQAAVTPAPAERPSQGLPNSGSGGMFPTSFPNTLGADQENRDRTVQEKNAQHQRESAAQQAKDRAETNASRATAGLPPINEGVPPPAAGAPPSAPATPQTSGGTSGRVLNADQLANKAANEARGATKDPNTGSRAEDIAAASGDPTKLPTDSRMVVQDKVNGGSTPVNKAPVDLSARTSSTQPPVAGPKAVADAKIGEAPPGMELIGTGWKRDAAGNKTNEREPKYAPVDDLYGKAKIIPGSSAKDINQTISRTPATADATKPVMLGSEQNIEQRRGDYQSREAPRAASMMARPAPPTSLPRGPASQPEDTRNQSEENAATANRIQTATANRPKVDPNMSIAPKGDPDFGKRLSDDDMKQINDPSKFFKNPGNTPANTRVTARRPATPEELKTGKVMPPVRRP